jgi:hypothetical protein
MDAETAAQVVGKTTIALTGAPLGLDLFRQWRREGGRVLLHWSVFFAANVGYLLGAIALLGWGPLAVLKRWEFVFSAAAVLPGAMGGTILMIPIHRDLADRLSLCVPTALFALLGFLLLVSPLQTPVAAQGSPYMGAFRALHLATLVGTGLFASGTLFYLFARLHESSYLILGLAFLLVTG